MTSSFVAFVHVRQQSVPASQEKVRMKIRLAFASILTLTSVLAARVAAQDLVPSVDAQPGAVTKIEVHSTDARRSSARLVGRDGQTGEATWGRDTRVLIKLRARPLLDRKTPGTSQEGMLQIERLAGDLLAIDARLRGASGRFQPTTQAVAPPRIEREFHTLFSGASATVNRAAIAEIERLPYVAAVYDDVEVHTCGNDVQLTGVTTGVAIGAPEIWSRYGVTGQGVKVAVIDTGIDYTHTDLGQCFGAGCKVAGGYDFVNNDSDPRDDNGHGTHVAGIIAANGAGAKGVAPDATLLAYKVLDGQGVGRTSTLIAGLERALEDGARIANLSVSAPGNPDDPVSQAVDNATAAGMLSVVAAGNAGAGGINSGPAYRSIGVPGAARTALTVGATNFDAAIASFSSRGYVIGGGEFIMKPEVVAPGVNILSTVPLSGPLGDPSGYRKLSGTSMAAPHLAGSAALLLQWETTQSPADLKARLVGGARGSSEGPFTEGAGMVDLVSTFNLHVLASTTHVSLGVAAGPSGIVVLQKTFSIRNATTSVETYSLAGDSPLPPGATLTVTPS